MVTIIVKDNETNQEMILRVSIDSEETGYYGKSGNECD